MYSQSEIEKGKAIAKLTAIIIISVIIIISSVMYLIPQYRVYVASMRGRGAVSMSVALQQNIINEAKAKAKADNIRAEGYVLAAETLTGKVSDSVLIQLIYSMPHLSDSIKTFRYIQSNNNQITDGFNYRTIDK